MRTIINTVLFLLFAGFITNVNASPGGYELTQAAKYGDLARVRDLIENGHVDIDNLENYAPALTWAASGGQTEVVEYLIEQGANIDLQQSNSGTTALINASSFGHLDIVKLLLAAGADISIETNKGLSATSVARSQGYSEIEQLLLAEGGTASDEAIQRQVSEFNKKEMAKFYGVLKKPNPNEYIERLSKSEADIREQLRGEHFKIVHEAEELSPLRCVSVDSTSFGVTTTDKTCIKTVEQGLIEIHTRNTTVPVNREKVSTSCNSELSAKFCTCLVRSLNGHFTQYQYELFLQSPRAFAAHIASFPEDHESGNNLIVQGAINKRRGRAHDRETVWTPSREIFLNCRG